MGSIGVDDALETLAHHAEPDDIADAFVVLASEDTRWVTGHATVVDGGVGRGILTGVVPAPQI